MAQACQGLHSLPLQSLWRPCISRGPADARLRKAEASAGACLALADLDLNGRQVAREGGAARVLNYAQEARLGRRRLVPRAAQPPVLWVNGHLTLARL